MKRKEEHLMKMIINRYLKERSKNVIITWPKRPKKKAALKIQITKI